MEQRLTPFLVVLFWYLKKENVSKVALPVLVSECHIVYVGMNTRFRLQHIFFCPCVSLKRGALQQPLHDEHEVVRNTWCKPDACFRAAQRSRERLKRNRRQRGGGGTGQMWSWQRKADGIAMAVDVKVGVWRLLPVLHKRHHPQEDSSRTAGWTAKPNLGWCVSHHRFEPCCPPLFLPLSFKCYQSHWSVSFDFGLNPILFSFFLSLLLICWQCLNGLAFFPRWLFALLPAMSLRMARPAAKSLKADLVKSVLDPVHTLSHPHFLES